MRTINCIITIFAILLSRLNQRQSQLRHNENAGPGAEKPYTDCSSSQKNAQRNSLAIICPGGGYGTCVMTYEGNEVGGGFLKGNCCICSKI